MPFSFSDESIERLRKIVEAEFGEPCTTEEARTMAHDLFRLIELVGQVPPPDEGSPA